jgi:HSP20 family protein
MMEMLNALPESEIKLTFPINVKAEEEGYVIEAVLPGVQVDDIEIQILNENLTISGEIRSAEEENMKYLLKERASGTFKRTLTLPAPLNSESAEAELKDGILTVKVAKVEEALPRKIKISA